ncbi:hypothetical protein BGZ57DRAFT_920933 [Hyaloscypha finlandica]|nr:hypothetical protein BGZ57DRAFT_920933 [Hyaloscypha finlandica]
MFVVHNNIGVEPSEANNRDVEILKEGASYKADGFGIELVEGPQICESSGVKLHRFKTLALPKTTEFEFELERNIEDTYPNYYYRPQNYGSTANFSGHHSAFNFAFNHQLHTVQVRPLPRKIDKFDIQVLDRELAKNLQGPLKRFVIATKPNHVVEVFLHLQNRRRPNSTILFVQRVVGLMEDVNKAVFPDPSNLHRASLMSSTKDVL